MESINSIINFSKHPINDLNYIQECHSLIKKNSLLILENFLLDKSLTNILNEAKQLEGKAIYCEQQHTILLSKTSNNFDDKLLSVDGDISKNIQIHNTIMQNGIMKMFKIDDGIELKKNSNFKFEQGKYHIMIMDIVNGVKKTNHYLNLNFERSKKIKINFETISFKQKLKSGH